MRKQIKILVALIVFAICVFAVAFGFILQNKKDEKMILHLGFNEGSGTVVSDLSGHLEDATVHDRLQPLQWRSKGVDGGSLLFDGDSTYIQYDKEECMIEGETFCVSVWFAPRAFEWDDPQAKSKGTQALTAIISQYNADKTAGILLGYQRFGQLCFEVGATDGWHTLWSKEDLKRDCWNHVAAVFDGKSGEMRLYLNGDCVGETEVEKAASIVPAKQKAFLIGRNSNAQRLAAGELNMFSGLIDDLMICADVMEDAQMLAYSDVPQLDYEEIALPNVLQEDEFRPAYHGAPYQHWMNEPHAPFYYNGKYHLFFQQNMTGTYWRNIQWGHLVSDDMVHWTPIKEAIVPTRDSVVPDGVWSGNATYDKNGIPLLFFTAGNDSFKQAGLLSNQNIGVAYPKNLSDENLTEWMIYDQLAVEQKPGQGRLGEFRDPYILKMQDGWYMFLCSGSTKTVGGTVLVYKSDKLELKEDGTIDMDWKYLGPLYELSNPTARFGTSWELPSVFSITNRDGTVTKTAFIFSPAPASTADNKIYYMLGAFDDESGSFVPDEAFSENPQILDYGDNVFTGPSILQDPNTKQTYLFSIMQDQRSGAQEGAAGWAHTVGLTRQIWLNEDGSDLCMKPIDALHAYEKEVLVDETGAFTMAQINEMLENIKGDQLHIRMTFTDVTQCELRLKASEKEFTALTYQNGNISAKTTTRGKEAKPSESGGPLHPDEGNLTMDIYIDRSLIEAFFNEQKSISIRSYSKWDAQSVFLADCDAIVTQIYIAEIKD